MAPDKPTRENDAHRADRRGMRPIRYLVGLAVVLYLLSGFYSVRPDEQAIVRRFGRLLGYVLPSGEVKPRIIPPGLHYHLPYPIERVDRIRTRETKTISVGFQAPDEVLARASRPTEAEFLTGDQNIMNLQMTVQYTISDPVVYLLNFADAKALLEREATAALTAVVATMGVDDLIGPARRLVSKRVYDALQYELKLHGIGVDVRSVNFQSPTPPQEVAAAFNEVQSAKAEMHRLQLDAESYRNETITRAQGEADRMLREAEAYALSRVEEARGEAERFEKILKEYSNSKELTSLRLYIEALEQILPKMRKLIVDSSNKGEPINIGIINTEK